MPSGLKRSGKEIKNSLAASIMTLQQKQKTKRGRALLTCGNLAVETQAVKQN